MRILVGKRFMMALVMLIAVSLLEIAGGTSVYCSSMERESVRKVSGKQGKAREPECEEGEATAGIKGKESEERIC